MVTLVGAAVAFILAFFTKMRKFASFRTVTSIIPYRTFYFLKKVSDILKYDTVHWTNSKRHIRKNITFTC